MSKKKNLEDIYYPVPQNFSLVKDSKPPENKEVIKRIIQSAVRLAYGLNPPNLYDYHGYLVKKPKAVASNDQMEMVIHLIESLQPADAIEAALASQFAITYIRAMEAMSDCGSPKLHLDLFEFGHEVLEALQKYRSKGAQQISVQYNHNQGQINNIKIIESETKEPTIEV
jgi:hypothetical protein